MTQGLSWLSHSSCALGHLLSCRRCPRCPERWRVGKWICAPPSSEKPETVLRWTRAAFEHPGRCGHRENRVVGHAERVLIKALGSCVRITPQTNKFNLLLSLHDPVQGSERMRSTGLKKLYCSKTQFPGIFLRSTAHSSAAISLLAKFQFRLLSSSSLR